jgi:c-di-GMP-binding flagellar brake protein YcgR
VLKVVRATHLLVIHELRRYVRIPVVSEVMLEIGSTTLKAGTVEVSSGGMSVRSATPIASSEALTIRTELPGLPKLNLRAYVTWARPADKLYGLRFDGTDERRLKIRNWIDQYLEIV